jgi:hypothetical protein
VPYGTYDVTLQGADNQQQVAHCVVNADQHLCTADLGAPDIKQILTGERP